MDKFLKYKQIIYKFGLPLLIIVVLTIIVLTGLKTNNSVNLTDKDTKLSLFKEDELVATRYTDSIEDKLNTAVHTQDNIQAENEKMKKELEALKQMILNSEQTKNYQESNSVNPNLYNNFPNPNFPQQNINEEQDVNISEPKVVYKVMDQNSTIDPNFGKIIKPQIEPKSTETKKDKLYIPTTAISTGTLLHGLNAPTSMSKPMPNVVMIKDVAFLPRGKELNIKHCNLSVEGYGQLSDERVYFKFVKFACVNNDGKEIYEADASGYITSLVDNKVGLPGHVVSKQDAMLGRMFLAGTFEGAAEMFKNTGQTQITSPLGTTTTQSTDSKDRINNMVGKGIGSAAESAKELYLEKARNISETVEILSQDVGLVFTAGLILEPLKLDDKSIKKEEQNEKNN
jgi:conjugal transfer pilus assembly protein TraB